MALEEPHEMLNDLILLASVVLLVPLAAIVIFRRLGKTKRTRRPLNSSRIGNDALARNSKTFR